LKLLSTDETTKWQTQNTHKQFCIFFLQKCKELSLKVELVVEGLWGRGKQQNKIKTGQAELKNQCREIEILGHCWPLPTRQSVLGNQLNSRLGTLPAELKLILG
jgi:hypothetical protein